MSSVRELIDDVRQLDLVLPEFQREYVWTREQAKQLMVSMFRSYPTGSLLFWKTDNPPEIKNQAVEKDRIGTTTVILDGQQRLTTLYLLTRGDIPPYYTEADLETDPRSLYFDLDSGDFQYFQATKMRGNPTWVSVVDCFGDGVINPFEVAKQTVADDQDPFELAERYNENLNRLRNIRERSYPIQTVPPNASIDDAIDVFDRVNSLGTKLTDAELALAHITGKWPQARQEMKEKIQELSQRRFAFDLTFMVRSLVGVVHGRGLFEVIHHTEATELKSGWQRLTKILDYLVTMLPGHAHIHSTEDLNTTNVFVPAVVYLSRNDIRFRDNLEMKRFMHWLYAASLWARYTSQTDQRIDHDISVVQRSRSPWADLVDAIIEQRGRIEVKPSDLEGRIIQHPLYRTAFVMAKARGAIDWFNGTPLDSPQGKSYAIHSHHIFPVSVLYGDGGYDRDNHLHKKIVNEIANRAFLTGDSNISLSNTEPAKYLPAIEEKYPGALAKQFVPTNPDLWQLNRYEDFLAERRRLIATAINERMAELLTELVSAPEESLGDLLAAGESPILEYKASMRWDYRLQEKNLSLQKVIAKTIAGMMNFEGGTLLIGVADDAVPVGIENDYKTLEKRQNQDGFEQALVNVLENYLGPEFHQLLRVTFEKADGRTICVIRVEPSPKPVYVSDKKDGQPVKEFFVRVGNTTRPLNMQAAVDYISMHWES